MSEKIRPSIQPVDKIEERIIGSALTKPKNRQEQPGQKPDNKSEQSEPQKKPLKKGSTFETKI